MYLVVANVGYPREEPPVQTKSGRLSVKLNGRLSQDKNWMKEVSSRAVFANCILNRSPSDDDDEDDEEIEDQHSCFKGGWTADDNDQLLAVVAQHGHSDWAAIATMVRSYS